MSETKQIAIIGAKGHVGKVLVNFFRDHYPIVAKDIMEEAVYVPENDNISVYAMDTNDYSQVNQAQLAVVAVPTQMKKNGDCDTEAVENAISKLETPVILIKSTIPPGTTKHLRKKYKKKNIVFSPEYIGEGNYTIPYWKGYPHPTNMKLHEFQIFGGYKKYTSECIDVFQKILGPNCKYMQTDSTTAEVVKYMENTWGATKVTFANEFYRISQAFGANYNEVRELFLLDKRTERMHTSVFKGKFGFGGKCFPKDVNAIVKAVQKAGYNPQLLKEVLKSNAKFKKDNKE